MWTKYTRDAHLSQKMGMSIWCQGIFTWILRQLYSGRGWSEATYHFGFKFRSQYLSKSKAFTEHLWRLKTDGGETESSYFEMHHNDCNYSIQNILFYFVCGRVCAHVSVHVFVCEHAEPWGKCWKSSSITLYIFFFLRQALSLNLQFAASAGLAGQWALGIHLSPPPALGLRTYAAILSFRVMLGSWPRVLLFPQQTLTRRAILPAWNTLFKDARYPSPSDSLGEP